METAVTAGTADATERPGAPGAPQTAAGTGAAGPGEWRTVAWRTGAADRAAAEAGIRLAYEAAGLSAPARIVWFGSPLRAAAAVLRLTGQDDLVRSADVPGTAALLDEAADVLAVHSLTTCGAPVREAVRTAPWERARRAAHAELGPGGWAAHWGRTGGELWEPVDRVTRRLREVVAERLAGPDVPGREPGDARTAVRLALLDAVAGQHDAPWLAALADRTGELAGQALVARSAGWWWPFEDCVLICERPVAVHRDEAGRLHHADGPCVEFPDGFALHAWRGMPVPDDFPARLTGLTPERIRDEPNAELRRVMLEHFGFDRYLADSGAEPIHRDETGVLWRVALDDDESVVMVEVVNSTPEPDGTHRVYWLRVPPHIRTARAGVAWTFGLTEEEYRPVRQT